MYGNNPRSTAQIAGHPDPPAADPLPDRQLHRRAGHRRHVADHPRGGWATASNWLLGVGLVTALLAAAATGWPTISGDDRVKKIGAATRHMIANIVVVTLEAVNLDEKSCA
jgi:uncharacterized membrane protein